MSREGERSERRGDRLGPDVIVTGLIRCLSPRLDGLGLLTQTHVSLSQGTWGRDGYLRELYRTSSGGLDLGGTSVIGVGEGSKDGWKIRQDKDPPDEPRGSV